MKRSFYILVTRDTVEPQKIISLYSPDLGVEFNLSSMNVSAVDESSHKLIKNKLESYAEKINDFAEIKGLSDLKQPIIPELQAWEEFSVEIDPKQGCFARILPVTGHVTNTLAIATGCFSTYMALCIANATSNDNSPAKNCSSNFTIPSSNSTDDDSANITIAATSLNAIINLIMYTYSDTSKTLGAIGADMDSAILRFLDPASAIVENQDTNIEHRWKYAEKSFTFLVLSLLLVNMFIAVVTVYQETVLLSERYLDLNPNLSKEDRAKEMELIRWLGIYLMIFTSVYSSLAFQWGFAAKFVEDTIAKIDNFKKSKPICFLYNSRNTTVSEIHESDELEQGLLTESNQNGRNHRVTFE